MACSTLAAVVLALGGCGGNSGAQNASAVAKSPVAYDVSLPAKMRSQTFAEATNGLSLLTYQFTKPTCSTHKRLFKSADEMCASLQLDGNNDSCAETSRKRFFKHNCEGKTWDVDATIGDLVTTTGRTSNCFFSEDKPTLEDLTSREKYIVQQIFNGDTMVLEHEHTSAIVRQSLVNGKLTISIQLFDKESGKPLGQRIKSWSGTLPDNISLRLTTAPHQPEIVCYPRLLPIKK